MKNNNPIMMGLGLIMVLMITACAPQTNTPAASTQPVIEPTMQVEETSIASEEQPVEPTIEQEAAPMDMEALIKEKVAGNHDVDRIFNANKSREEWNTTLDRMIGYGAKITEEEKQMIIEYLLSR
jgi:predicted secreted protein